MNKRPKVKIEDVDETEFEIRKKCENLVVNTYETAAHVAREKELQIMRDAHTLLLNKQVIMEKRSKSPTPTLNDFINYTDVSEFIIQSNKPIKDQIPILRELVGAQNRKIVGLVTLTKQI